MADNPVRIDTLVLSGSLLTVQDQVIFINGSPVGTGNFALDINLVKTTGDQGISGYKILSSANITSGIFIAPNNFSTANRTLSSSTGTVFDYQNGFFYNTGSLNTLDIYNRLLKSGNSILNLAPSLDWNKKELYGEWITRTPVNSSGLANKEYVDSLATIPVGVTGLSFSGSPYLTGAFELTGIGSVKIILSGSTILFSGVAGAVADWGDITNKPTGFTPNSSNISVTGGIFLPSVNLSGVSGIKIVQSGNDVLFASQTAINGIFGNVILTGQGVTAAGNTFSFISPVEGVTSIAKFGDTQLTGNVILSGAGNVTLTTVANTIILSGIISTGEGVIVDWDNVVGKPDTFPQTRSIISGNTMSLGINAFDSGFSFNVGKSALINCIETDQPAWIRLYSSTGYRSGDYSRAVTIDPTGEHGLMLEVITTTNNKRIDLAPPVLCYSNDGVNTIYGTVKNLSAGTTTIGVAVTRLLLEE